MKGQEQLGKLEVQLPAYSQMRTEELEHLKRGQLLTVSNAMDQAASRESSRKASVVGIGHQASSPLPPLQRSYTFQPHDHEAGPPTPTRERQHSDPGHQRSRRASMPDITDVSERRDSLFRQTDSGKSVYNSLEEFST